MVFNFFQVADYQVKQFVAADPTQIDTILQLLLKKLPSPGMPFCYRLTRRPFFFGLHLILGVNWTSKDVNEDLFFFFFWSSPIFSADRKLRRPLFQISGHAPAFEDMIDRTCFFK